MCNDNYHFYVVRHGRQRELFSASSDCIPYRIQVFCGRILHSVEKYSFVVFLGGEDMTYHRLYFKSNTTYATSGLLTVSEHLSLLPVVFGNHISQSLCFV
jgi:hypothetical protein